MKCICNFSKEIDTKGNPKKHLLLEEFLLYYSLVYILQLLFIKRLE